MFDDFLDELRRRQAEAASQERRISGTEGESDPGSGTDARAGRPAIDRRLTEDTPVNSNGADSDNGGDRGDEDRGVFRGGGYRGPRRPRSVGSDGEMPEIHIGRGWVILGITIVAVLILLGLFLSVGVGLWTDAIWFQSVGYASVF